MPGETRWQDVAARRRVKVLDKIPTDWIVSTSPAEAKSPVHVPRTCGLLDAAELRITESRALDVLHAIHNRRVTAVEVTHAFCKRAAIAHQLTNCLAEVLFDEALSRAAELDEYMRIHNKPIGPLHGLPISVKEHIYMEGTTATSGLIAWADQQSPCDALIVQQFREQGAVFHVKTTNPQTLMALETVSNLFGRTVNPYNTDLTSGGSSGGESALLAMRGSPLGIGTDIGGSIRVPSAFCGIYGFKPSVARTPHGGLSGLHDGMHNIVGVVGPMAHSIEDIELFLSAALRGSPWLQESAMIPLPWNSLKKSTGPLRIGIMLDDGLVHPHPPVMRAMQETVEALQGAGHTLVDWAPGCHDKLYKATNKAYFLDGGDEYYQAARDGNEPPVPVIEDLLKVHGPRRYTVDESWKVNVEIDQLRNAYAKKWNDAGLDCVICPVSPSVACAHDESKYWGYSCTFNMLDYPGCVLPVGHVRANDTWEQYPRARECSGPLDEWHENLYTPERYSNAPLSIQVVGRRLQEEKVLQMSRAVEDALRQSAAQAESEAYVYADEGPSQPVEGTSIQVKSYL